MTPEMQRALIDLSTYFDIEPTRIFRRVLEVIAAQYDGTMAMINLIDRDRHRIGYREIINPHPLFKRYPSISVNDSY